MTECGHIGVDAFIISDLGVMALARRCAPQVPVHVSTQAGVMNEETARFLYEQGAARVVLARELSLQEVARIRANTPAELEIETFVHGSMCVSFSGRCLLSNYLPAATATTVTAHSPAGGSTAWWKKSGRGSISPLKKTAAVRISSIPGICA